MASNLANFDNCNKETLLLLKLSISDDLIPKVQNTTVAGDLWESLLNKYQTSKKDNCTYENPTVIHSLRLSCANLK